MVKFKLPKLRKRRKINKIVKEIKRKKRTTILTPKQISKKLTTRRDKTLQKIIDSPRASPASKARARQLLNK